jgi:glycerol-3-phosphate dehydrogenase (NAD(P)+)
MKKVLVLGGGAFATSIANVAAVNAEEVFLCVRQGAMGDFQAGENTKYLPRRKMSSKITVCSQERLGELCEQLLSEKKLDLVISGLPTSALRPFLALHAIPLFSALREGVPFVSLTKGIDHETLELPDDVLWSHFPKFRDQICFLSGPSFAEEIMDQQITLVSLAGRSKKNLERVALMLRTPYFRAFPSYDVKGVLLGGALKNILAIAGGALEGMGLNHNTRAAMITRGINEMLRFGVVFNARPETFYGLSGMGDLILTTTGGPSRNRAFGLEIAKGRSVADILSEQKSVVEGVRTALAVHQLIQHYDIRARLFEAVYRVLYEEQKPKDVLREFMAMPIQFES